MSADRGSLSRSLADVLGRATNAERELLAMARAAAAEDGPKAHDNYLRLIHKREGVALVKSYIDEAICWAEDER